MSFSPMAYIRNIETKSGGGADYMALHFLA